MPVKLDEKLLKSIRPQEGERQLVLWDEDLPGFGIRVSANLKGQVTVAYIVNTTEGGKQRCNTIGHRGKMTLGEARVAAKGCFGRIAESKPTVFELERQRHTGPTVRDGFEQYRDSLLTGARRRPKSVTNVNQIINGWYFADWMELPLRSITAAMCRAKHTGLVAMCRARNPKKRGYAMANSAMRKFQQMWRYISAERSIDDSTWPNVEPTKALLGIWFPEPAKRAPISWSKLPAWWGDIQTLSPVVRDYHIVGLLTGLRRECLATARWDHINLEDDAVEMAVPCGDGEHETIVVPPHAMFLPFPKGGAADAFMIPLSQYVVDLLRRRRNANATFEWQRGHHPGGRNVHAVGDAGWVFPAQTKGNGAPCSMCAELGFPANHPINGVCHIVQPCQKDRKKFPSPHHLRYTFKTAMVELRLPDIDQDVLMNHAWATGDSKKIYVKQNFDYLIGCQEEATKYLLTKAGVLTESPQSPPDLQRQVAELKAQLAAVQAQLAVAA